MRNTPELFEHTIYVEEALACLLQQCGSVAKHELRDKNYLLSENLRADSVLVYLTLDAC